MIALLRREALAARVAWLAPFVVLVVLALLHQLPFGHRLETGAIAALLTLLTVHYLGAVPFGHEFDHGTVVLCLMQPRRRIAIWAEKVLTGALLSGGFLWIARPLSALAGQPLDGRMTWFLAVNAVCAGPLMVQLSRSTAGGAGLALLGTILQLVGAAIAPALLYRSLREPDSLVGGTTLLHLYGVACLALSALFWCWHQDRRSTRFWIQPHSWGTDGVLPSVRMDPRQPVGNLWRREWMLQRGNAVTLCGVVAALMGVWAGLAVWFPEDVRLELLTPLVVPVLFIVLMLVLPCLCGVTGGADRQLGTGFLSLALPVAGRRQMHIRLVVGLTLSLVAASVPLAFSLLDPGRGSSWGSFLPERSPSLCLCIAGTGYALGWLAAQVTRSALGAMVAAVVGVFIVGLGWYEAADWLSPWLAGNRGTWAQAWDVGRLRVSLEGEMLPTLVLTLPPAAYVAFLLRRACVEGSRLHSQRLAVLRFVTLATLALWLVHTAFTAALLKREMPSRAAQRPVPGGTSQ